MQKPSKGLLQWCNTYNNLIARGNLKSARKVYSNITKWAILEGCSSVIDNWLLIGLDE